MISKDQTLDEIVAMPNAIERSYFHLWEQDIVTLIRSDFITMLKTHRLLSYVILRGFCLREYVYTHSKVCCAKIKQWKWLTDSDVTCTWAMKALQREKVKLQQRLGCCQGLVTMLCEVGCG